jgi:quinolinate synthase
MYMKMTTLPKVLHSLEALEHRITVPREIASRARLAIDRMLAIGGSPASQRVLQDAGVHE